MNAGAIFMIIIFGGMAVAAIVSAVKNKKK